MDKWLYAIKNLGKLDDKPTALTEAIFKRFFEVAEIAAFSRTGEDWEKLTAHAETLKTAFPDADIRVYPEPPFPVSSTEIREKWEQ